MNHILSIAKKELRAYFLSPLAMIFLAAFLAFVFGEFFSGDQAFFARNIADVRPMFQFLPVLLIPLTAALTMRLWSEEQKLGTLEVLLTLPVKTHELVVGKFLGALALVAVALLLTVSIPVTVSMLGDLDLGPVVGGYVGALLLAGAYLAIGLCISSLTENQVIALIGSSVVCGVFYLAGAEIVTNNVGNRAAEILAAIGTGSRFESVRRGVIDLADLSYYFGIAVTFLGVNTVMLKAKGWSDSPAAAPARRNLSTSVVLIAANAVVLNVLLASGTFFRLDLTERGEYSISPVTRTMLKGLEEPLLIRGYFSNKTHPLLAPMVPRIRDMIEEYGKVAGGKVITEYVDPREDAELEKEANQNYGIKSFPFKISDRLDQAVVNSYFSILVKYGDQYEVLNFSDLIEVQVSGMNDVEVKLRNLEYDLTRTIKKVAFGFGTADAVFAKLDQPAELYAYVTAATLPENFKKAPETIKKVMDELVAESKGKFKYEIIDPDQPGAKESREVLLKRYGFKPFAVSLFAQETFYLHLLLKVGDRYERLPASDDLSEADLKKDVFASLKRAAPGFLKTVGLAKPPKKEQPQLPPQFAAQQPPPEPEVTQMIQRQLGEGYTVEEVDLKSGKVPGNVDVLLVYRPEDFNDQQKFAIDQHLMRGGTVIVLTSKFELDAHGGGVKVKKLTSGVDDLLASYGVTVMDAMVLDTQNEPIPMPVERELRGMRIREMAYLKYPYFVDVRPENMADGSPVVAGLPAITLPWASPLNLNLPEASGEDAAKREATVLLSSSKNAYLQNDTNVQPDFEKYGEAGFAPAPADRKAYPIAVVLKGSFDSFFKGKADPTAQPGEAGTVVERSADNARLIVVGSTAFANDLVLQLTRQAQSNLQLVQNMVDYGLEDVDLLSIRSRGTFARTLLPLEPKQRSTYELANYAFVVVALGALAAFTLTRRKRVQAIDLLPDARKVAPRMDKGVEAGS